MNDGCERIENELESFASAWRRRRADEENEMNFRK
jgi:hypothetical protein